MDLTAEFNAAARGDGDAQSIAQGPSPSGPSGDAVSAEAFAPQATVETAAPAIARRFDAASREAKAAPQWLSRPRGLTVREAEAELESLEAGRPDPAPRNNAKPQRRVEEIVHTRLEERREARVAALKAFLASMPEGPENAAEHGHEEDLEPSW